MRPVTELDIALAALLPEGLALACTDPGAPEQEGALFAAEAAAMARAVPKRRAEFVAGRLAAHRAMTALGRLPEPVPMGADRAPVWPRGLVGSISHCEGACAALLGEAARWRGVAIDLEPDADLPADLVPLVCGPAERAWLAGMPEGARGRAARLVFAAKECVYKLQYPMTGWMLDFGDVEITVDAPAGRFDARILAQSGDRAPIAGFSGRFGHAGGVLFCVMYAGQINENII